MKLYSILAFVTFALAAEELSSPNVPSGLRARAIGSKCSHNVSTTPVCCSPEFALTQSQGESGSCQKTSTCANDNGWYSDGDCKKGW